MVFPEPNNCQITLHSPIISLKDFPRFKMNIDKTYTFRSLQSKNYLIEIPEDSKIVKIPKNGKKQKIISSNPGQINTKDMRNIKKEIQKENDKESSNHFIDSYEKFKSKIQDTDLLELLKHKTSTIDFNLKNYGNSLLCKLLLLVKYVNKLVGNDFQSDLQEFLHINILKSVKIEVPV